MRLGVVSAAAPCRGRRSFLRRRVIEWRAEALLRDGPAEGADRGFPHDRPGGRPRGPAHQGSRALASARPGRLPPLPPSGLAAAHLRGVIPRRRFVGGALSSTPPPVALAKGGALAPSSGKRADGRRRRHAQRLTPRTRTQIAAGQASKLSPLHRAPSEKQRGADRPAALDRRDHGAAPPPEAPKPRTGRAVSPRNVERPLSRCPSCPPASPRRTRCVISARRPGRCSSRCPAGRPRSRTDGGVLRYAIRARRGAGSGGWRAVTRFYDRAKVAERTPVVRERAARVVALALQPGVGRLRRGAGRVCCRGVSTAGGSRRHERVVTWERASALAAVALSSRRVGPRATGTWKRASRWDAGRRSAVPRAAQRRGSGGRASEPQPI